MEVVRSLWNKAQAPTSRIDAAELHIEPGTFFRADNTEVQMQKTIGPSEPGIVFVNPESAVAFSQEVTKTPPDELMMIVPGPICPLQASTCNRINLHARLANEEKNVIAACCHSIGKQAIIQKLSPGDGAKITDSTKVMFVVWRSETEEVFWSTLTESPIQTVFKALCITPSDAIAGAPGGRSWRAHRQNSDTADAESFCFYARVLSSHLPALLRKSGIDGIYTTPKSEHSSLADSRFSVVWVNYDTASETRKKADEIDVALGIVLSSKEKPSWGIRSWAKDFDALWQLLRPSDTKPQPIPGENLYKLTPVPVGATNADVQHWVSLEKLPLKPLRALGPSAWLLAGEPNVERQNLTWKRNAIMLRPLESRAAKANQTILASKPTKPYAKRTWKSEVKDPRGIDPLSIADPWAQTMQDQWGQTAWWSASATSPSSSSTSRPASSTVSSELAPQQQKDLDQMKTQINALEKAVQSQQKDTAGLRREVQSEIQMVRKEVGDKVSEVKDNFQQTLATALGNTQEVLRRSFKEDFDQLKALLGAGSRKRAERDEEMAEG